MRSVIYIDRNNLYFYGGNVHSPVAFPFPQTAVKDMEVVNSEELAIQITEWIKNHKIESSPTLLLLASTIYFQKEIPDTALPDQRIEMKKTFIENVPFNDTHIQEILVGKSILLVAVNTDFVYSIRDIFQTCGFVIEAIAPIAEIYGLQPIPSFSAQVAQDALKKISKDNGFPLQQQTEANLTQLEDTLPKTPSNNRLYIMIGVFIILIAILGILFYMQRKPKRVKRVVPTTLTNVAMPSPTLIPTFEAPQASASSLLSVTKQNLSIQVLNGSGIPGQADTIRQRLIEKGFRNITTGNAGEVQSSRTLIIFKKEVGESERNEIIKEIELFSSDYTVQEKQDIDGDVLITTSRQTATPTL